MIKNWLKMYTDAYLNHADICVTELTKSNAYQHRNCIQKSFHTLRRDTICCKLIFDYLSTGIESSHNQYELFVPISSALLDAGPGDAFESNVRIR